MFQTKECPFARTAAIIARREKNWFIDLKCHQNCAHMIDGKCADVVEAEAKRQLAELELRKQFPKLRAVGGAENG